MATDYEKKWGPRWLVTEVLDPNAILKDLAKGDRLSFEGTGATGSTSKIWNHTKGAYWGEHCVHDTTKDHVTVTHKSSTKPFQITRSPGTPVSLAAKQTASGGAAWTATEGG